MEDGFATTLRQRDVLDAVGDLGIDVDTFLAPLVGRTDHPYRRYRWSAALGEAFAPVVHAVPPEEEMGWTPWERWTAADGEPRRHCWVAAPDTDCAQWRWRVVDSGDAGDLRPRFARHRHGLRDQLHAARADAAFAVIGVDLDALVGSLDDEALRRYEAYRWAVIPHFSVGDGPVVYALPPAARSDEQPWESWYRDETQGGAVVHHVHYTAERPGCIGPWSEPPGAPQRPPEVLGNTWYWSDAPGVLPAMATPAGRA